MFFAKLCIIIVCLFSCVFVSLAVFVSLLMGLFCSWCVCLVAWLHLCPCVRPVACLLVSLRACVYACNFVSHRFGLFCFLVDVSACVCLDVWLFSSVFAGVDIAVSAVAVVVVVVCRASLLLLLW